MKKTLLSIAIIVTSFTTYGQVGVGTSTPEGVLDVVSTTAGVVFPRVANAAAVTTPVNGMAVYDLSLNCFNFYENGVWSGCKYPPPTPVYCTGSATAIVDVTNPTTGKTWMDRNLGATQVATSSTDSDAYGDLYQWGRFTDGHQCRTSGTTTDLSTTTAPNHGYFILTTSQPYEWLIIPNGNLWQGVAGTNNPCPSGYRLPTETELNNERLSWSSNNTAGAFGSPLKFTLAGTRFAIAVIREGTHANYWSSTYNVTSTLASHLYFDTSSNIAGVSSGGANTINGMAVRCIKD